MGQGRHHDQYINKAKREILEDIASGRVPATVRTFSELHDYLDANEYVVQGLFDSDGPAQSYDDVNAVLGELDAWLAAGHP